MSNVTFVPKGFYVGGSYVGYLPGNKKMLFPTEKEYLEYVSEATDTDVAS